MSYIFRNFDDKIVMNFDIYHILSSAYCVCNNGVTLSEKKSRKCCHQKWLQMKL